MTFCHCQGVALWRPLKSDHVPVWGTPVHDFLWLSLHFLIETLHLPNYFGPPGKDKKKDTVQMRTQKLEYSFKFLSTISRLNQFFSTNSTKTSQVAPANMVPGLVKWRWGTRLGDLLLVSHGAPCGKTC